MKITFFAGVVVLCFFYSYDAKTTRMVSALGIEVLDDFLKLHPGALKHPFDKTVVVTEGTSTDDILLKV